MNFIFADTEDDSAELLADGRSGFDKTVTQIAAVTADGTRFHNAGDVPGFLKWLAGRREDHCYFHNLQYDLGNVFGDEVDAIDPSAVGGRMIKAGWGPLKFADSFNLWPMALKKVGAAFGLKKLEFPGRIADFRDVREYGRAKGAWMARNKEYVFRDCEIGRRAMLFAWEFAAEHGIGRLPATLGGLCMKLWKAWGGVNVHDSSALSRLAFYGGRVELFKVENASADICYTDINSLYPSVMCGEYPDALEPWDDLPPHGVATVTVKVPKTVVAPLPWRNEDGQVLYPWGTFTGTWTMPELRMAMEHHGVKVLKFHEALGSDSSMRPYKEYVEKLYDMRQAAGSDAESLFFKLLMNNLYGRLGSSGRISKAVWQTPHNKNSGVPYGSKVWCEYLMPLDQSTNWCHAAYVTAYGRMRLLEHIRMIGAERMIYCDTDSCIFDCPGRVIPFATGSALGQMKLESWERHARIYAPKMYELEGLKDLHGPPHPTRGAPGSVPWRRAKAKGVPVALADDFIHGGSAAFDLPFKFREAIRFYDRGNIKKLSVWRRVEKVNHADYTRKKLKGNNYFPRQIRG